MVCVAVCVCGCLCLKCLYIIYEIHTKLSIFCSRGSLLTDGTHTRGIHTHTHFAGLFSDVRVQQVLETSRNCKPLELLLLLCIILLFTHKPPVDNTKMFTMRSRVTRHVFLVAIFIFFSFKLLFDLLKLLLQHIILSAHGLFSLQISLVPCSHPTLFL